MTVEGSADASFGLDAHAAGKLVDLVTVLRARRLAGRRLTEVVQRLATPAGLHGPERPQLVLALRQFIRMYRPHEAREGTILFPAFRELVGEKEYAALGESFEDRECCTGSSPSSSRSSRRRSGGFSRRR